MWDTIVPYFMVSQCYNKQILFCKQLLLIYFPFGEYIPTKGTGKGKGKCKGKCKGKGKGKGKGEVIDD